MHLRCVAEGEGVIAEGEEVIAEGEGVILASLSFAFGTGEGTGNLP